MRHYEIVFLVHPDQSEQASAMAERYQSMVEATGGSVHRVEDWGRRLLAYPIDKIHKAHYYLMNIECGSQALDELTSSFRFNDAVLRHLVVRRSGKITDSSPIFQSKDEQTLRESESNNRKVIDETKTADEPKADPMEGDAPAGDEQVKENQDG